MNNVSIVFKTYNQPLPSPLSLSSHEVATNRSKTFPAVHGIATRNGELIVRSKNCTTPAQIPSLFATTSSLIISMRYETNNRHVTKEDIGFNY